MSHRLSEIYTGFALAHGALRSLYYTQNAMITERDENLKPFARKILLVEKFQISIVNSITNIAFCPFTVLDDIGTFEMYMCNIPRYRNPLMFNPFILEFKK
jgi:hypothetical protein